MSDFDIADLRKRGFVGFVPVAGLTDQPPPESGVYTVVREATDAPRFLARSDASWFKGKDPTVSIERLQHEWVAGSQTLYFGKAKSLQERIGLLAQFSRAGRERSVFHWGGRLLWQLDDGQQLLVAWKVEPDYATLEADLIDEFRDAYGSFPFANLLPGSRPTRAASPDLGSRPPGVVNKFALFKPAEPLAVVIDVLAKGMTAEQRSAAAAELRQLDVDGNETRRWYYDNIAHALSVLDD